MENKISFSIVGCGNIGIRHAEHISRLAHLSSVCDSDEQKRREFQQKFPSVAIYSTLEQLLENDYDCEVVNICTPNNCHAQQSILAMKHKKHVVCEKPMALSVLDANKMIMASQKYQRQLFVVKQNRFNPPVQQVKTWLDNEQLGKILMIVVNCFWNRNDQYYQNSNWKGKKLEDGGTLFTQFSHFIDIVYFLAGDMVSVHAIGKNLNHKNTIEFEDSGLIHFELANGAMGSVNYTTTSHKQNMEGSITIFGEKGTVKIGGQYLNTLEYCQIQDISTPTLPESKPANQYGYYQGSMSNHDKIIKNVINTLCGRENIATSGFEGMKTVQIIEAIYDSMQSGVNVRIR